MSGEPPQIPAMTELQSIMDPIPQNGQLSDYLPDMTQNQAYPPQFQQPQRNTKKQKFIPEEDEALVRLYQQYGNDWKMIAAVLKNRTPRQCRDRWKNYLAPDISRLPWTQEDDELLYEKYREFGRQWAVIAKSFPGRTDIHIKNRWVTISKQYLGRDQLLAQQQQQQHQLDPTIIAVQQNQPQQPQDQQLQMM